MTMVEMKKRADTLNKILEDKGAGFKIVCQEKWKDNRMQTAYILFGKLYNCCPAIYYDGGWYDQPDETVVDFLIDKAEYSYNVGIAELTQPDYIRAHILPRVVNGDNLAELKKSGIASRPYLNLAVLYYLPVDGMINSIDGNASVQISDRMLSAVGMTEAEAYDCAVNNLAGVVDAKPMIRVLEDLSGVDETHLESSDIPDIWVVTTKSCCYGASVLLYGKSLFRVLEERFSYGSKVAVLPSSCHEVLAVPYKDDAQLYDYLQMVREVNSTCVSEEDYLSDNVYYYDCEKGEVMLVG